MEANFILFRIYFCAALVLYLESEERFIEFFYLIEDSPIMHIIVKICHSRWSLVAIF